MSLLQTLLPGSPAQSLPLSLPPLIDIQLVLQLPKQFQKRGQPSLAQPLVKKLFKGNISGTDDRDVEYVHFDTVADLKEPLIAKVGFITLSFVTAKFAYKEIM
ncbi:hypothetical protein GUJ93_ZPchr0008g13994 [Zizania palustris]|uniref:Uncharacterized protein n=1 Tax=Zizania palustris TaxID=103762 RepID=A0A8J5RFJ3_ZIZPA|nr:hypothetical protein GUJ93_ZPchr0008g13994 [Zizania palustris]